MTSSAKKAMSAKTITTKRAEPAAKKEVIASVSSRDIDAQIKAFLSAGGEIQKIPNGVSGQQPSGQLPTRKHIVISRKKA